MFFSAEVSKLMIITITEILCSSGVKLIGNSWLTWMRGLCRQKGQDQLMVEEYGHYGCWIRTQNRYSQKDCNRTAALSSNQASSHIPSSKLPLDTRRIFQQSLPQSKRDPTKQKQQPPHRSQISSSKPHLGTVVNPTPPQNHPTKSFLFPTSMIDSASSTNTKTTRKRESDTPNPLSFYYKRYY